uniref:Testis expressed 51 n=1 Tax=Oryctolagus cuniculus TaxID=9986 RepID=A0A5F9C1B2_RABIT
MLLLLLTCLLPTAGGKGCLRCWPELPALLNYDLQILWGSPGPPAELSQNRNHLEEATAKFFNELDQAIKKWRDDKPLLLEEVHMYKSLLAEKLTERSGELKERDIHTPLEITECANCGTHFFSCDDPALCPAKHRRNHKLALGISTILLVALAGDAMLCGSGRRRRKRRK